MRINEHRYEIESTYRGLREGETQAGQVCPSCKGGATKEGSLSVSRSRGSLLFNCHRASCKFSGVIILTAGVGSVNSGATTTRSKTYIPTTHLSETATKLLAEEFRLTGEAIDLAGIKSVKGDSGFYSGRVCFPIYGPDSRERGASYRSYDGATPKSIIRLDEDGIALSWYIRKRKSRALVIVEDQVSAIRVSSFYDSVALLSTNFSEAKVKEVKARGYSRVFLCLDNDATAVAVRLAVALRTQLPQLRIIGLPKDIKNMDKEEFESFLTKLQNEE